jgi:hypothetical protein
MSVQFVGAKISLPFSTCKVPIDGSDQDQASHRARIKRPEAIRYGFATWTKLVYAA